MTKPSARLERALLNPGAVFRSPDQVEHDPTLGREDKLAILESWEEDARELAVAEEENMAGGEPSRLAEVLAARTRVEDENGATPRRAPHVRDVVRPVRETLHADHALDEAALQLSLQDHPMLPVSDGDEIVGILGPADLARVRDADVRLTAREVMTAELSFCYLDDSLEIAQALLDRHGCDHLLVIDADGTLVGILARADLPPVGEAEAQLTEEQPGLLDSREENTQAMASKTQPGGLGVYAQRPTIRRSPSA